jgi:ubiquinone/menaquinone biosynthesis C-methylase UbiE
MNPTSVASSESVLTRHHPHVCPWWLGFGLACPIRRWFNDPNAVLGDFVKEGERVLEIGPGPGFYTVSLARRVGAEGKVVCVDVQQRMLASLVRRMARHGLADRIEAHCCAKDSGWLDGCRQSMDRAVLIYVLHEVPHPQQTLAEVYAALRPGGSLLLVEPKRHCSPELFAAELWAARQVGFSDVSDRQWKYLAKFQTALLQRPVLVQGAGNPGE